MLRGGSCLVEVHVRSVDSLIDTIYRTNSSGLTSVRLPKVVLHKSDLFNTSGV